ncbi:HAAS signaling domain-containing protein [Sphingobacterium spiritivorum]|uniref:HAAS signaling domain-containing protein n=1 Tax=Sphingobacterium spiritivorum TaxID=258 RepID=UPI003DA32041
MKFKEIAFKDKNSKRIYLDYISRIQQATKSLDKTNQQEILLEINSHIYESIADSVAVEKGKWSDCWMYWKTWGNLKPF